MTDWYEPPEDPRKWDERFLALAAHVSEWSKDPSTKCGAVIVRPDRTVASMGFNGFPRAVSDRPAALADREEKYKRIIHCEMNAILFLREPAKGFTLYTWPFLTCERCAVHVIQSGISRVVAPEADLETLYRWGESFKLAESLYSEAGVEVVKA